MQGKSPATHRKHVAGTKIRSMVVAGWIGKSAHVAWNGCDCSGISYPNDHDSHICHAKGPTPDACTRRLLLLLCKRHHNPIIFIDILDSSGRIALY